MIPRRPQTKARVLAVVVDTALFNLALLGGYLLGGLPHGRLLLAEEAFDAYQDLFWIPLVAVPAGLYFCGLYRRDPYRLLVRSAEKAFMGCVTATGLVLALTWVLRGHLTALRASDIAGTTTAQLSRLHWGISLSALAIALALGPVAITLWRFGANRMESALFGWSRVRQRLVVAGWLDPRDLERLGRQHSPCYTILGHLAPDGPSPGRPSIRRLGSLDEAGEVLAREHADELLLVASQLGRDRMLALLDAAAAHDVRVWVVADVYGATLSAVGPGLRDRLPLLEVRKTRISGWTLVVKRLLDIGVSLVALAFAAPLLLLPACVAIVVESKGFPIFSQDRVGQGGQVFRLYKLRTMVADAPWQGPALTQQHDERITRIGRLLRRTSIDEIPQLWNVLRGDMSLVGPRAVVPYVVARYEDWERATLNVKPGLTGLAQVSGRDAVGFREKSLLNLYYVRNYSLWLDLRILFATAWVVLSGEGTGGTPDHG